MRLCYHCMTQITDEKLHTCPHCGKSLSVEPVSGKYLQPGTVLQGKFIVGYPIGAGGFGNTYIGWNQVLLRKVAIKEFYPEQYISRGEDGVTITVADHTLMPRFRKGLKQFLEEARSVAMLHDVKGVVEISNFFEENGTGYIVMEYLEGMDVKTILKKSGSRRDYEWSRRVILTLLHTLREIHKRGVLHRDIAPDNIFVTNDGVIKLIDFGAAKHASELANANADIMLKVGYAPIEQYGRKAPQGPYTDLYAVAALFYRMLTGQKPIPAIERLQDDALIPPSEMGVQLPEQAELAIMVCLNVKPEFRLQSADEFMEALDGQDFIPVYEPEWILGSIKEENSFLRWIAGLPIAAKAGMCALGICLVGGLIFGGVAISGNRSIKAGIGHKQQNGIITIEDYKSGYTIDKGKADLEEKGFKNISVKYQMDERAAETIIDQSILPGTEVSLDEQMEFTVSGGNGDDAKYTIEDFKKKKESEIKNWFTSKNFEVSIIKNPFDKETPPETVPPNDPNKKRSGKIEIQYIFSNSAPKGECYDQTINNGEKTSEDQILASDNVTIMMSLGKKEDYDVTMPDLRGKTRDQVKKILKKKKLWQLFDHEIDYRKDTGAYSEEIAEGGILKQEPAKGKVFNRLKDVNKHVKLHLTLSDGPKPTPTPRPVTPRPATPRPRTRPNNPSRPSRTKPPRVKPPQVRLRKNNNEDRLD